MTITDVEYKTLGACSNCGRPSSDEDYYCLTDRQGNNHVFCDEECASIFEQDFKEIF
jgi:hypothetical protein